MQSGLDGAIGLELGMRAMMKEAVGQGSAQPLMEEHEEQCDFHAFGGEAIGVVCTVALEQSVGSHLAQVVAQWVKPVALGG